MLMLQLGEEPVPGYRLKEFLGEGLFGKVWKARGPGDVSVALKFIDLGAKVGLKELRGVKRVKDIRDKHLLSIFGLWLLDHNGEVLGEDVLDSLDPTKSAAVLDFHRTIAFPHNQLAPAVLVVAMQLADKTLSDRNKECKAEGQPGIPVKELLRYMEDAARGIDYLNEPIHDLGDDRLVSIRHCDVKPGNIVLVGRSAVVSDFGLARIQSDDIQRTTTGAAGTPAYMAPECIEKGEPSETSDQYALAVTYFELRTGQIPFATEDQSSAFSILRAHTEGRLTLLALPEAEQAVIRRATARRPDQRYSSCQEMVDELRRVVSGHARPRPMPESQPITKDATIVIERTGDKPPPPAESTGDFPVCPRCGSTDIRFRPRRADWICDACDHRWVEGTLFKPSSETPLHEVVQFTIYRPRAVRPAIWYKLLAFAHRSELPPDAEPGTRHPLEEVARQAEAILGQEVREFRHTTEDASRPIPPQASLTFVPMAGGVEFEPPQLTVRWFEIVRAEFRMRADARLDGHHASGRVSVLLGDILLADINLSIAVKRDDGPPAADTRPETSSARPYRNIFASYSHQDSAIVNQFEDFVKVFGDRYFRDWTHLRAGEAWVDGLRELIKAADVFQLFWSCNSMRSRFVRHEYEFALSLNRPNFVRPFYWEVPFPQHPPDLPPPQLKALQFERLVRRAIAFTDVPDSKTVPIETRAWESPLSDQDREFVDTRAGGEVDQETLRPQLVDTAPLPRRSRNQPDVAPVLELLDEVMVTEDESSHWSNPKFWIAGGAVIAGLLLLAIIFSSIPPEAGPSKDGMVAIAAGTVQLGNAESDLRRQLASFFDEPRLLDQFAEAVAMEPYRRESVDAFWIDRYEVTNADYALFLKATGRRPPKHFVGSNPPAGKENHPVVHVTYEDATAYADWAGKKLPTREQWLRAFRADREDLFPWGNQYTAEGINVSSNMFFENTSAVTATPNDKSPFGVCNMVGNVSEYIRGHSEFNGVSVHFSKGASWAATGYVYGVGSMSVRIQDGIGWSSQETGFRCVVEK